MTVENVQRVVGGYALIAAPMVWGAGLLMRYLAYRTAPFSETERARFAAEPFAAPEQLATYVERPALFTAGLALYLAGVLLLLPATAALVSIVATRAPRLAILAGWLFALGLISRVYMVGVEQMAISLTGVQSLNQVSTHVLGTYAVVSYGPWRIPVVAAFGWYLGALLLAIAAYRARVFGIGRLLMFLWTGTLWAGVLKETSLADALSAVALLIALGPLGIQLIRSQPIERATRLW